MMMRKALVTGANGFIGAALTQRLLRDGIEVRAMCRRAANGRALAGAEVVEGNILDAPAVHRYAQGCDVVFHVAAVGSGSAAFQYNVNVEGTRHVIHAAHEGGAQRFIHVSTIAVYGPVNGRIDESQPHRLTRSDFYGQSKSLGEKAAWSFAQRVGLPMVSVRPGMVIGPRSQLWSKTMYEIASRYPIPMINEGHGHAHPIYVDDVVDLLVTAATHPAAPGQAFHAAPDPAPTWADFMGCYARMAGNTRPVINIPVELASPLAKIATMMTRFTGRPVDVTGSLQFWASRATYSMACAADLLGWQPKVSLAEGMALTEPWLKGINHVA